MSPPLAHDPAGPVIPRQYAIDPAQSLRGYPPRPNSQYPPWPNNQRAHRRAALDLEEQRPRDQGEKKEDMALGIKIE